MVGQPWRTRTTTIDKSLITTMYAAHAEQKKQETSQRNLENCLEMLQENTRDDEKFSALLTITYHMRSGGFTDEDRLTVLEVVGLDFLIRLVTTESQGKHSPAWFYKAAALSVLSAWTVEPYITQHAVMRYFLTVVNDVISPRAFKDGSHKLEVSYEQMCSDCEEIVSNLTKSSLGIEHLLQSGTLSLMVQYATSPTCQNVLSVLSSLCTVLEVRGGHVLDVDEWSVCAVMKMATDRLADESDLRERIEYAKVLTSFLNGLNMDGTTVHTDWVVELAQTLKKLLVSKIAPEDGQIVLGLVCGLVSTVGPEIFSPDITGDNNFLKSVVAHVAVEIYILLDGISLGNVPERYSQLDRTYKLLSSVVLFVAESGESMDSDSVIVIYRKLVEVGNTVMEFLSSVANQEIEFPKNHGVVLISVRTLAAMLSEITEDPTPELLSLLPFFNLLCEKVKYSDDVVMEVKDVAQAALANIKLLDQEMEVDVAPDIGQAVPSSISTTRDSRMSAHSSRVLDVQKKMPEQQRSSYSNQSQSSIAESKTRASDSDNISSEARTETVHLSHCNIAVCGDAVLTRASVSNGEMKLCESNVNSNNRSFQVEEKPSPAQDGGVCLSHDSLDHFRNFQASIADLRAKPQPFSTRKVSFCCKNQNRHERKESSISDEVEQWKPKSDDVLSYLLPAYTFLLDCDEAVEVMVLSGVFQTVLAFLETSLSHLLENRSSASPECTTMNALSVIELVYTNSPSTTTRLECFQEFFQLSVLSLPNMLSLPSPPPHICLKLLEVTLAAYRIQMRENKRNCSLPQLKHSQSRLFKAIVEYLRSFCEFKRRKSKSHLLYITIKNEFKDMWHLLEDSWCGCVAGLCMLVRSVGELQDALNKSPMIPDFLAFMRTFDGLENCSEVVKRLIESMLSLVEMAAEGCHILCLLILHNQGLNIARKFGLSKLELCLQDLAQQTQHQTLTFGQATSK